MKTSLIIGLLAFAWSAQAQPFTVSGTQATVKTNITITRPVFLGRGADFRNGQARSVVTTPVERHTLTFSWRGKSWTITDDIRGESTTNYEAQVWQKDLKVAAAVQAAKPIGAPVKTTVPSIPAKVQR